MTILEALRKVTEEIKAWAEIKFFNKNDIDSALSSTSENPVQNKVINNEISDLKNLVGSTSVSDQITGAINNIVYPVNSVNGKTGDVQLTASDVGALPDTTNIPSIEGLATETYVDNALATIEITVDASLTQANKAADSKAAGDAIRALNELVGDTSVANQITSAMSAMKPKLTNITLQAANWVGDSNPWSQIVTVNGVTSNSRVDLRATALQVVELQDNDIALMAENDNGVVTVYALGGKPTVDYTIQAEITEVVAV